MNNRYVIKDTDGIYTKRCKEEANIYLASLPSNRNNKYIEEKEFDDLVLLANTLDKVNAVTSDDKLKLINKLHRLVNLGFLSPLTLNDSEFINNGHGRNKRFMHIYKVEDTIYNEWAFNILF